MMNDEPRKASDILLSLESKVNDLVKTVAVYDFNTKLILDRVNKMYAYISILQNEMAEDNATQNQTTNKEIVQSSTEHLMTVEENPKGQKRTSRVETYTKPQVPFVNQIDPTINQPHGIQTERPTKQTKPDGDRKVPVIQRITDQTGKDLFMAEVMILDANKELVSKTKTNAAGKWQAYLKPGLYSVNIVKTDTATKAKLEAMQDITVSNSDTTITLPVMIIKR
jgi:hypothetical protein